MRLNLTIGLDYPTFNSNNMDHSVDHGAGNGSENVDSKKSKADDDYQSFLSSPMTPISLSLPFSLETPKGVIGDSPTKIDYFGEGLLTEDSPRCANQDKMILTMDLTQSSQTSEFSMMALPDMPDIHDSETPKDALNTIDKPATSHPKQLPFMKLSADYQNGKYRVPSPPPIPTPIDIEKFKILEKLTIQKKCEYVAHAVEHAHFKKGFKEEKSKSTKNKEFYREVKGNPSLDTDKNPFEDIDPKFIEQMKQYQFGQPLKAHYLPKDAKIGEIRLAYADTLHKGSEENLQSLCFFKGANHNIQSNIQQKMLPAFNTKYGTKLVACRIGVYIFVFPEGEKYKLGYKQGREEIRNATAQFFKLYTNKFKEIKKADPDQEKDCLLTIHRIFKKRDIDVIIKGKEYHAKHKRPRDKSIDDDEKCVSAERPHSPKAELHPSKRYKSQVDNPSKKMHGQQFKLFKFQVKRSDETRITISRQQSTM